MTGYYLALAFHSLRRNAVLTTLMVLTIGVGIAGLMTVLTVLHAMTRDPIPAKSARLFAVQIDNWGPDTPQEAGQQSQLSHADAQALSQAHRGVRESPMYSVQLSVTPAAPDALPLSATGRAAQSDFFSMFDAPFQDGRPWSKAEDDARADVVVLGSQLANTLFPDGRAVGATVRLDEHDYRVVGVLKPWRFQPRVYDLTSRLYSETEQVFLPIGTAIDRQLRSMGSIECKAGRPQAMAELLTSECRWLQFWVELPNADAANGYRQFLTAYASEQQRLGRFQWPPKIALYNAREWQVMADMVPGELRISSIVALGFLMVCVVNAIALMLARFSSRADELSIRRALGASRAHIVWQCLTEASVVGVAGGVVGLGLTTLGVALERTILREDYVQLASLDAQIVIMTLALAVIATICSGIYPAWGAGRVQSVLQLKSQ